MTEQEFDVLDELYFVTSFKELCQTLDWKEEELLNVLQKLADLEYIKGIHSQTEEDVILTSDIRKQAYKEIFFLATKKGLMAHNSRS